MLHFLVFQKEKECIYNTWVARRHFKKTFVQWSIRGQKTKWLKNFIFSPETLAESILYQEVRFMMDNKNDHLMFAYVWMVSNLKFQISI